MGSFILAVAEETRVPAGDALAVDRQAFASKITSRLQALERVKIIRQEVTQVPPEGITIIASGPLTSPPLAENIQKTKRGGISLLL